MPICKCCFKQFAIIQASHVKKEHGFESLEEYRIATEDIEIPDELAKADEIYREELRIKRSLARSKKDSNGQPIDNTDGTTTSPSGMNKSSLNSVLQGQFKRSREE